MEKMKDLNDLLQHEIQDLYSAEEQIIAALPKMIEKCNNPELRQALEMHLKVTEGQRERLDRVRQMMSGGNTGGTKKKGGLAGLFSSKDKCLGMEGLIREGEKVLGENMTPEVTDAAIIACAQKIEHYEICGYGTARAYARELNLGEVAELLEETLDEEYEADDRLTDLAVGRLNEEAQQGGGRSRNEGGAMMMEEEEEGAMMMASSGRGRTGNEGGRTSGGEEGGSSRGASGGGRSGGASKAAGGSKSPSASKAAAGRSGSSGNARSTSSGSSRSTTSGKSSTTKNTSGGRGSSGTSGRGLASANERTRKEVSKKGGEASRGGGRSSGNGGRGSSRGR